MAKIQEILEIEGKRTTAELKRQIHFFPNGKFYSAYEWSAWLCVRYIHQFKVVKRDVKSNQSFFLIVGFPKESLEKYTIEDSKVEFLTDESVLVTLSEALVKPDKEDGTLEEDYQNWHTTTADTLDKQAAEKKETDAKQDANTSSRNKVVTATGIIRELLRYKTMEHSPFEWGQFITGLQQDALQLL